MDPLPVLRYLYLNESFILKKKEIEATIFRYFDSIFKI